LACDLKSTRIHEYHICQIRDLPILDQAVVLHVSLRRIICNNCGQRMERISWLDRYARLTTRLAEAVVHWCSKLPIQHVAECFGLHWETVCQIDRRQLQPLADLPEPQPRWLVMDEFALYKGHRYATVRLMRTPDACARVGEGRNRACGDGGGWHIIADGSGDDSDGRAWRGGRPLGA